MITTATTPARLLPVHWAELQGSTIAAEANVASWGPGTDRHWELEQAELVRFARLAIQTASTTASGLPQAQPGHLAPALIALDQRYRHLQTGGWRTPRLSWRGSRPPSSGSPISPASAATNPGKRSATGPRTTAQMAAGCCCLVSPTAAGP